MLRPTLPLVHPSNQLPRSPLRWQASSRGSVINEKRSNHFPEAIVRGYGYKRENRRCCFLLRMRTTAKVPPPPPLRAQYRSTFCVGDAIRTSPVAVTTSHSKSLSTDVDIAIPAAHGLRPECSRLLFGCLDNDQSQ